LNWFKYPSWNDGQFSCAVRNSNDDIHCHIHKHPAEGIRSKKEAIFLKISEQIIFEHPVFIDHPKLVVLDDKANEKFILRGWDMIGYGFKISVIFPCFGKLTVAAVNPYTGKQVSAGFQVIIQSLVIETGVNAIYAARSDEESRNILGRSSMGRVSTEGKFV